MKENDDPNARIPKPTIARRVVRGVFRLLPDVPVTRNVPLLGRFRFRLRRHRWLMGSRCFDSHVTNLAMFHRLVRPGDVVYDVGANIGYYVRYVLAHLKPKAIVAFEPMTENVELLEQNAKLAGEAGSAIRVVRCALSDHDGQDSLQIDDINGGTAVLDSVSGGVASKSRRHRGLPPKSEPVRVMTLDSFLASEPAMPRPDVIKIDTEGAEVLVLSGATSLLASSQAPRLLIATHGDQLARDVVALLARFDYHCAGYRETGTNGSTSNGYGPLDPAGDWRLLDNNLICSRDRADVEPPLDLVKVR